MNDVALFDAKNRLSELINRVEAGEEIAITRRGKVVARLVPAAPEEANQRARDAMPACAQVARASAWGGSAAAISSAKGGGE